MLLTPPISPLFPYTTLFRSHRLERALAEPFVVDRNELRLSVRSGIAFFPADGADADSLLRNAEAALKRAKRSEEHTSELQSLRHLVCRLLLEKKKTTHNTLI